jgi:hypothetical protein
MDCCSFHHLNGALLTLVPKKPNPVSLSDYHPISLIHSFGKIFSKAAANCFAPHLPNLISTNQSAFIKGRLIHDNFRHVLGMAKLLSSRKLSQIMFKIDLAKAFDSVGWVFLLELLVAIGCPRMWTNWISTILSTASIRILLNGTPGERIFHGRGLRQGDPLSPMLFVLVMECFHALFRKADSLGLLQQLGRHDIRFRASLYADDVVTFSSPVELDLQVVKGVLALFEGASGLAANFSKSHVYPINCSDEQISLVCSILSCSIAEFS